VVVVGEGWRGWTGKGLPLRGAYRGILLGGGGVNKFN